MANKDNPKRGVEFEGIALKEFAKRGVNLERDLAVEISAGGRKKRLEFDLGSASPPVLVECKRHSWTEGGNSPSAKTSVWNEAMYHFSLAPGRFRKILYVLRTTRGEETLAHHYIRRFEHMVPPGVEIWEYNPVSKLSICTYPKSDDAA